MAMHGMLTDGMAKDSITMNGKTTDGKTMVTNEMHAIDAAHAHVAIAGKNAIAVAMAGENAIAAVLKDLDMQWMSIATVAHSKSPRLFLT